MREVDARARFVHAEPLINTVARTPDHNEAQFEAWDMLTGRAAPELGGRPDYLDIAGLNYYPDNQWRARNSTIPLGHHLYRPLRELLARVHGRYGRPLYLAETGAEGSGRAAWLYYVGAEVRAAMRAGVPVEGVCVYPILDYPGWEDERHCEVGLNRTRGQCFEASHGDRNRVRQQGPGIEGFKSPEFRCLFAPAVAWPGLE